MTSRLLSSATVTLLALTLAACGGGSSRVKPLPAPSSAAPANSVDSAFDQMMAGNDGAARKQLRAVLKASPNNAQAQMLLESMQKDPVELLGPQSYAYTVRAGDTIVGLAQRLLGNRLKAYQLLRYNKLEAPTTLTAGQTLRIPGEPPRPEPVRRPDPTPAPSRPAPSPTPAPTPAPKPKPAPAAPSANPTAARQARAAGLTALNQGNVTRAVALLRRAAALDPGNALIARDLARAERIAATVRAKR